MDHADHVALIRDAIDPDRPAVWADLGSGEGAFTLALADLLPAGSTLVSVDRDGRALAEQERQMIVRFPDAHVRYLTADFTGALDLPALDGLLMANSLHFVRDKPAVMRRLIRYLRPGGRFVLVEYDADHGNPWVPHPLSYPTWERVSAEVGLLGTRRIGRVPSRFLNAIYSAVGETPLAPG